MFILFFIQVLTIRFFVLKICYLPPYSIEIWQFKEADTDLTRKALNDFNWERAFTNTNVTDKICTFNKLFLNVLSNFIPHVSILRDDKDPPWFNSRIQSLLQARNTLTNIIHPHNSLLKNANFLIKTRNE